MNLNQIFEEIFNEDDEKKKVLVIYPGRFSPMHYGHLKTYESIKKKFPEADVYISPSDVKKVSEKDPFAYKQKLDIIKTYPGVKVFNTPVLPYKIKDTLIRFVDVDEKDMKNYIVIFAYGAKDEMRLREGEAFIKYKDGMKLTQPAVEDGKERGYFYEVPEKDSTATLTELGFTKEDLKKLGISDDKASGTNARIILKSGDEKLAKKLINEKAYNLIMKYNI
jgi:cytidyltransferase-like protein